MANLLHDLERAHRQSEQNFEISSFWDSSIRARIGDKINGWKDEGEFPDVERAVIWVIEQLTGVPYD